MYDDSTIVISVEGEQHPVLCGHCKQRISTRGKGKPKSKSDPIGCAHCNNWGGQDEVAKIAIDYAMSQIQLTLSRAMKETLGNTKGLKFEGQTVQNKRYRFVI
ncbi:hypothetical protein [Roseobacter sp. SK209-2-6]|uniref:hypothetical protein n=1 Tax=Roseobacter sp. SK209-2-6 TaxID=388739 RepID=UPI0012F4D66F|nr:hypothetical protein [Roseobacter sp. SK209-2-6]